MAKRRGPWMNIAAIGTQTTVPNGRGERVATYTVNAPSVNAATLRAALATRIAVTDATATPVDLLTLLPTTMKRGDGYALSVEQLADSSIWHLVIGDV